MQRVVNVNNLRYKIQRLKEGGEKLHLAESDSQMGSADDARSGEWSCTGSCAHATVHALHELSAGRKDGLLQSSFSTRIHADSLHHTCLSSEVLVMQFVHQIRQRRCRGHWLQQNSCSIRCAFIICIMLHLHDLGNHPSCGWLGNQQLKIVQ